MPRGGARPGSGPKPMPEAVKRLMGSRNIRPDVPNTGEFALDEHANPEPPDFLDDRAIEQWRDLTPKLGKMRVLTELDLWALAATCEAYSEYRDCADLVQEFGRTYETFNQNGGVMVRPRPEVAQKSDAWRRWIAGLREFGLTPSARTKVSTSSPGDEDEFESFLRGGAIPQLEAVGGAPPTTPKKKQSRKKKKSSRRKKAPAKRTKVAKVANS